MSADAQGMRAGVLLQDERFDLITRLLGCKTELARAHLLDVDPKTVYRARRGVIGEEFIAKTLSVMKEHEGRLAEIGLTPTFEAVFKLGEKQKAA
ncbi:MAG: hypothetical protein JWO67_2384 [Streptosporangiaceae bacterium]|jgi:hypothetical protein|nr:hypothetical protein [Streptosporangiaceae bacterium]